MSEKKDKENVRNAAISGAATEPVQRYGAAAKEYIVAYSGMDYEKGCELKKNLESISKYKVNPKYQDQNLKQQAGFAAEVLDTANTNAANIINKNPARKPRTDDLGRVNDQLFDHFEVDAKGNIIPGTGTQMKFVGKNPKEAFDKLKSEKYDKYFENSVKIEVPSDFYDGIIDEANKQINDLKKQVKKLQLEGKAEKAAEIQKKLDKCEKIKKNTKKSSLTNKEAMSARTNPKQMTNKKILDVSHKAGKEAAEISAIIGGSVSIIQNLVSLIKGEESAEEALVNVTKDTATSAIVGYGTGYAGSAITGMMQNAKNKSIRVLSKTGLPSEVVAATIAATKTLSRYFKGDITGIECFEQLGEQGTGQIAAAIFAAIGKEAISKGIVGEIIGGMVGGMVGYALSSACYTLLITSAKDAKLAEEIRIAAEKACEEHIKMIKTYRAELEENVNKYFDKHIKLFINSFNGIKISLQMGDIDGYISSINQITEGLGKKPPFTNQQEFDDLMNSTRIITI